MLGVSESECGVCGCQEFEPLIEKAGYVLGHCLACGVARVVNPPSAAELAHLYSAANGYMHYAREEEAAEDREARRQLSQRRCNFVKRYASPGRLLDVGCGEGMFLSVAQENGWQVSGLELDAERAGVACERYGIHDIHSGVLEEAPFARGQFDVITMWDVIEHVPVPAETVAKVGELLAPGGLLIMITPNIDGLFPRLSYSYGKRYDYWRHPEPPYHLYQFSKRTIRRLLTDAGFSVEKIVDQRISFAYSFGNYRQIRYTPKYRTHALLFALPSLIGPWVRMGDEIAVVARRPEHMPQPVSLPTREVLQPARADHRSARTESRPS